MVDFERWWINGASFRVAVEGEGEPLVLLHGFPELWYSWRKVIPILAERRRVVAPDLRGFGGTEITEGGYKLHELARDVAEIITRAGGGGPVDLVGHDWGGVIGWRVAATMPSLVSTYTAVAGPHPARYAELLVKSPRQALMSMYTGFFQIPWLPERILSAGKGRVAANVIKRSAVRPGADEDLDYYREAWSVDTMRAGINYYRELGRSLHKAPGFYKDHRVACPALIVWGEGDAFLSLDQTRGLERWVDGPCEVKVIRNCGHWIAQEAPEEFCDILLDFIAR